MRITYALYLDFPVCAIYRMNECTSHTYRQHKQQALHPSGLLVTQSCEESERMSAVISKGGLDSTLTVKSEQRYDCAVWFQTVSACELLQVLVTDLGHQGPSYL
jgi:hypothetical protein